MGITVEAIKELRNLSLASIADCKKALNDTDGDVQKAFSLLRKRGLEKVAAKGDRVVKEGRVEAYIHHGNKIGKEKELYYKTHCLMEQPFIKDPSVTIKDLLGSLVAKFNENIVVRKFVRYKIGE
jgi:elongation factor Ts